MSGSGQPLTMTASRFRWMDCKPVKYRVAAASETQLLFEVDPKAKCSWAGWLVAPTENRLHEEKPR